MGHGAVMRHLRSSKAHLGSIRAPRGRRSGVMVGRSDARSWAADSQPISEWTVKTHVASILRKLGLRDRTQVVVAAYESGLVRPDVPPDMS